MVSNLANSTTQATKTILDKPVHELHMEDAVSLAMQIDRYEQGLKLMKDRLKKFVELNGPVTANGKVWDFHQSTSWNFDAEGLKNLAGMMTIDNLNPYEYFSLPSASLKKLRYSDELLAHYGTQKLGSKTFKSLLAKNYQN